MYLEEKKEEIGLLICNKCNEERKLSYEDAEKFP